jgi:hypothetical protein
MDRSQAVAALAAAPLLVDEAFFSLARAFPEIVARRGGGEAERPPAPADPTAKLAGFRALKAGVRLGGDCACRQG